MKENKIGVDIVLRRLEKVAICFVAVFLFLLVVIGYFTIVIYSDDCDDTPWCPVGKVVKYDFVCGKKIRITEEYCRFFGGKLENGKCDATYSLHHRKRCETLGGVFVRTGWLSGECNFKKKCLLWQKYAADDVFSDYRGKLTAKGSWEDKEDVNG